MGLRLRVRESEWLHGLATTATERPGLVPVVKGNGYGFGRRTLMPIAAGLGDQIAVGTVYEASDVPSDRTAIVLTPHIDALPIGLPTSARLTVGNTAHVEALQRQSWGGSVSVKLRSSMRRYGASAAELPSLIDAVAAVGLTLATFSIHLPLSGDDDARVAEIDAWLPSLPADVGLSVSHLGVDAYRSLRIRHPDRSFEIRVGTALWHRDKSQFELSADVLDVHPVAMGDAVGYRQAIVPADGTLVVIGTGSAHGVRALDDGRSPFHFQRQRLTLLEPPHMHTSLTFVPAGSSTPAIGDRIDVQRPLITTMIDELEWISD
ncbi:MAG: alanine racemase [Ilumatobacteraceae bacterium]